MYGFWYWFYIGSMGIVPSAVIMPSAFFYSHAVFKGLVCARYDEHRMTPLSPWDFFDREFRSRCKRIFLWGGLWLFVMTAAIWFAIWDFTTVTEHVQLSEVLYLINFFLALFGLSGFIFAWITILAPRSKTVVFPALLGGAAGTLTWCLVLMAISKASEMMASIVFLCCFLLGVGCYFLTWRYVRRKLNHAWFRFDD